VKASNSGGSVDDFDVDPSFAPCSTTAFFQGIRTDSAHMKAGIAEN